MSASFVIGERLPSTKIYYFTIHSALTSLYFKSKITLPINSNTQDEQLNVVSDVLHVEKEKYKSNLEGIDSISKKVQSLFFKLQCDLVDTKGAAANRGQKGVTVSRPDSKFSLLIGQGGGVSESNVLDYMAIIEQRAVDIISEYLRGHVKGPRSPTPGPATPMHWPLESLLDLSLLNDEEAAIGVDGYNTNDADGEGKLINLNTLKETFKKSMQMSQQHSVAQKSKDYGP